MLLGKQTAFRQNESCQDRRALSLLFVVDEVDWEEAVQFSEQSPQLDK